MPILVDRTSRVICFGMMQEAGYFQIQQGLAYGTQLVALVEAGNGGKKVQTLPVFNSAKEAKKQTNGDVALIMSPPEKAADAILEANEAGIGLIVCLTEGVPVHDIVAALRILRRTGKSRLIGPGSCGLISPEQARCGLMPGYIWTKGGVGIIATVDTLAYEVAATLTAHGIGQSSFVGIGHEMVSGSSCVDILELFEKDPWTHLVMLIGSPLGKMEQEVKGWLLQQKRKPLVALIAGRSLSRESILSHCGENCIEAERKISLLREGGAYIVHSLTDVVTSVQRVLEARRSHESD